METIDLSKAKIGDKFRTRCGYILVYVGEHPYDIADKYLFRNERGSLFNFFKNGYYMLPEEHRLDLVEQVFDDEKDIMNLEIDERRNREMQKFVEDAKDENQELQRRQEVIELAEKMYIMFENETLRYHLNRDGSDNFCSENLREMAIIRAASFINKKHKYLKEGKLC